MSGLGLGLRFSEMHDAVGLYTFELSNLWIMDTESYGLPLHRTSLVQHLPRIHTPLTCRPFCCTTNPTQLSQLSLSSLLGR